MNAHFGRILMMLLAACAATPAAAVDLSAELGVVSDYRYRGLSLSNGKPAAQASVTIEHDSGAYALLWTSTIEEPGFDADAELDLTGGYAVALSEDLTLDLSATYYVYPSEAGANFAEATAAVELSQGPATFSAGLSIVPGQDATRDDDGRKRPNSYAFVGADYEVSGLPLTLSARLGRERGYFDEVAGGGKWDWSLVGSFEFTRFRFGVDYSGSDAGADAVLASFFVKL